eukprot:49094-Chlamydomonas_euryale.AAC.1
MEGRCGREVWKGGVEGRRGREVWKAGVEGRRERVAGRHGSCRKIIQQPNKRKGEGRWRRGVRVQPRHTNGSTSGGAAEKPQLKGSGEELSLRTQSKGSVEGLSRKAQSEAQLKKLNNQEYQHGCQ